MPDAPIRCPKCAAAMERGFILDIMEGGQAASRWAAGAPTKAFWAGVKAVPADEVIPIAAFRCESCGYLESYARPEFAPRSKGAT